ncbi:hypothetical protein MKW92_002461 [Papaver armeniacum]|nr:hypothetical protein MKW92_002461 [Papaver armeniacum]
MAHRFLRDLEADGWERSDFPIICESCLGDNPYVRMTKADYDKECKICTRPFTVFRWRPGRDARFKKTEVCQTCSKLKNVCQVCLLDLEYGLPVQVRDTALAIDSNDSIPKSDVNREYFAEEHDRRARAGIDYESSYGKARPNDTILKLQRTTPYYKRNRAHVCSFFVRGECTRGAECPYRHEMPITGELSQQNIKDRYYGYVIIIYEALISKLLNKAGEMPSLAPPDDQSIKTLYIDNFYSHGEIESVRMVLQRACAFVTYTTREGAEKAAEELSNKLVIKGLRLKLLWGRSQAQRAELENQGSEAARQQALTQGGYYLGQSFRSSRIKSNPQGFKTNLQHLCLISISHLHHNPRELITHLWILQRMGAVVPSQEGSSSGSSGLIDQGIHYPYQRPPMQGHYPSYYPPYGYMAPPPPYQQYSHQPLGPQPPPPMGAQPYHQQPSEPQPPFQQQPPGAAQPQPPHEHKPSDPPSSSSN